MDKWSFPATVKGAAGKGSMNTLISPLPDGRPIACLKLRTGRSDCIAQFYPALYQLDLDRDGQVERIDLVSPAAGYSNACCKAPETWSHATSC